jgi:acyl carrier protein
MLLAKDALDAPGLDAFTKHPAFGDFRMSTLESDIIGMIAKRSRIAAPAPVTLSSTLDELGLESLDVIEMAFDLEERFNIEIPFNANNSTGPAFKTVSDVVSAVQRLMHPS